MVLSTEWSQVEVIDLVNDGNGLGFILVGGRSTGVVIKALTPGGVAERDGRLQCGDHLLQIGDVNLRGFSSEQVATVLRQTGAQVRLIVARPVEPSSTDFQTSFASHAPIIPTKLLSDQEELSRHLFHNPSFATSAATTSMSVSGATAAVVLTPSGCFLPTPDTELADLPLPPLPNDLPASLQSQTMAAATTTTRMCPKDLDLDLDIIPFSIISPPPSVTRTGTTTPTPSKSKSPGMTMTTMNISSSQSFTSTTKQTNNYMDHIETVIVATQHDVKCSGALNLPLPPAPALAPPPTTTTTTTTLDIETDICSTTSSNDYIDSPETETYEVILCKNVYGLGITVAGYVCEEEDLSGIFVKSIIEGSAAEMSGQIQINDRIVAVDGTTLGGVTNHQAVEILRNTDIEVHLTLERFLRGRKYEHLQVALTELKCDTQSQTSLPPSPSIATLSWLPPKSDADSIGTDGGGVVLDFGDLPSRDTVDSNMSQMFDRSDHSSSGGGGGGVGLKRQKTPTTPDAGKYLENGGSTVHVNGNGNGIDSNSEHETDECNYQTTSSPPLKRLNGDGGGGGVKKTPTIENINTALTTASSAGVGGAVAVPKSSSSDMMDSLKVAWKSEFPESEIIVAEINKLSGLGISLEGTVDVEGGIEKRPHHYIRSILEDGPVGRQGILKPGDELLQVNEFKLQGLKHIEVVKILKELPAQVKLVCVRGSTIAPSVINTSQNPEAFESRSLLPGGHQSLQNLLTTKAQSESSLHTSSTATLTDQQRSKSLENVSGLALWSSDVTTIEIEKTELGFGFSILDYQDPLDSEGSVIVIRGLIRGGAAEATNDIFPGDRLVSVGEHSLQGLTLDEAVSILKGMPRGVTKLGICRPLSSSDSNIASPVGDNDSPST